MMGTPLRMAFFGDSLTLGVGDPDGEGWVGRLTRAERAKGIELTAYNLGIRRETSVDVAARWQHEARPRLPATVRGALVFAFGTNDCLIEEGRRRVELRQSIAAAHAIFKDARAMGPVLMIGPPPSADDAENREIGLLSRTYSDLCLSIDLPFLNLFEELAANRDWQRELQDGDRYHPGSEGYRQVAALVRHWAPWRALIDGPP